MPNTDTFTCRISYQGGVFLVWKGNVLLLTTSKPSELVAACRGQIVAPKVVAKPKVEFESVEDFLARGGKIRKVKATALGFEFSEEDIARAAEQLHRTVPEKATEADKDAAQPLEELDISDIMG